jgi:intein/homing endonuclease
MRKNIQTKNFIKQFFTSNEHPFNLVKWKKFKITLSGYENFPEVEFPEFYSQNAVNIVATKYFKVVNGKQETSLKELISRVVKTFKKWGQEQGYFDSKTAEIYEKELTYIILHQYATFNSPVWFNVGVPGRSQQCSACQPYRSLVSTPFGFIPIGRIVEERLVGLPVYDSKGITFVTGVKENGFKEVYKIYLKNGLYIEATGDHLVKVSDVYDRDGNKFKWLRVDELKPGMRLYVHFHNVFSEKTYPVEKNVDANQIIYCQSANSSVLTKSKIEIRYSNLQKLIDEAALAGWLQGDGFVGKYSSGTNKSWIIEFMAVNEEQLNYLLPKIEKVFEGVHYKVRETFTKTGRRIWRIRLYGNKLKNFIEKYDLVKRREDMRVPQILFSAPKEAVVSYLKSFFDCEGYVSFRKDKKHNYENSRIGAATISKNLMEDVLILLTGLGIYAKLYSKKEKRQNRQDTYCIEITYGNSKKLFAELIGFISKEKIEKLNIILNEFKHKNHNPFRNEEIVKIEKLGVEKVYDIQTLSGEYLSNNVAIHNCFILDVEDNMESILDWIKTEGMIFKGGSGSGVNLSKLRGKGEKLSTGGASSGVISFMRAADAVAGSIKCLPKGTEILTKEGIKKIEDLKENDEVLTRFGFQKNGGKYYTGKKKIYKITTELGIEILASGEHKFLVRREGGIEEWKELRELDLDKDYLILDLSLKEYGTYQKLEKIELQHHNERPIKMPEILDEKFAEWLGLLYGDGNITNIKYANKRSTRYIGFQVDAQDKDLIKYIQDLSYELFGVKSFIHRRKDKKDNSVSVRIASHPLIRFLKVNGLYKTKGDEIRVPEKIKNSPPAVRAAFLRGYFESDGSITKNKPYPTCSSINKEFIEDIQDLLFSLGILNKKRISKSRKNSYGKKPVYNLIVTSSFGIKRFFNLVNFISERKKRKFERAIKILDKRPFEQRWILPYPENDFEIVYQNIPNETRYFFRRLTSKYFRETVGKTNFNRFRASLLLNKFPFLENTFIGYFAKNDVYYEKIKEIKFVGEEETYDIFVPDVNEYLVKNIVVHNSGGSDT